MFNADWPTLCGMANRLNVSVPKGATIQARVEPLRQRLVHHLEHRLPSSTPTQADPATPGPAAQPARRASHQSPRECSPQPTIAESTAGLLSRIEMLDQANQAAVRDRDAAMAAQQDSERVLRDVMASLTATLAERDVLRARVAAAEAVLVTLQVTVSESSPAPSPAPPPPPPAASPPSSATPDVARTATAAPAPATTQHRSTSDGRAPARSSRRPRAQTRAPPGPPPARSAADGRPSPFHRDWVFQGFQWESGCAESVVHTAVRGFMRQELCMSESVCFDVLRVSARRAGLAVVRFADAESVASLRRAKRGLPGSSCRVSIYCSLPPHLQQHSTPPSSTPPPASTTAQAAARSARDAQALATRRVHRRTPEGSGTAHPVPPRHVVSPSRFAVLECEERAGAADSPVRVESTVAPSPALSRTPPSSAPTIPE